MTQATQAPWSVRMADTVLQRWPNLPPAWSHEYGVLFKGLENVGHATQDGRYMDYIKRHIDAVVNEQGEIQGYELEHYSLDHLNSGRLLFGLHDLNGESNKNSRYLKAAAALREQYRHHPRTPSGGFWHNKDFPNQMLLDGVYMGSPFYAEYAAREKDMHAFDDIVKQIMLLAEHSRDASSGLFYHGWDESGQQFWANPQTGCSPSFWSRATGWYVMAIVDVLDILPASHPQREAVIKIFQGLMQAIASVQDDKTGLWWLVLDQKDRPGNYLEASGSCMFIYALAKGIRMGYLSRAEFLPALQKAFAGALVHLIRVEADDSLSIRNVCKTAGLGIHAHRDGSFDYYVSEPKVENDLKGMAAFMLAAEQMECLG